MKSFLSALFFPVILLFVPNIDAQEAKPFDQVLQAVDTLVWSDIETAIQLVSDAIKKPGLNALSKANLFLALSKVYNQKRDCEAIARWNQAAEKIYEREKDQRGLAEVLYQKGFEAFCRMEYEKAMQYVLEGLQIMEDLQDQAGIALGHLRMSRIFHFTYKMAQSAEYGRLAGQRFEEIKDYIHAWDSWSFAGHGYRIENDSTLAVESFQKCMEMARRSNVQAIKGLAYNDLAAFYGQYEVYDSAIYYFENALKLADPKNERQIMVTKNGLGQVYLNTGQYQKCIDLLSEAMQVVLSTNEIFFLTELPEYIAQAYAGLGQYDSAYKYMEMNWRYSDSLFTQNQDQALEEMKSKYESDQKDQLIVRQKNERKYGFALLFAACFMAFMFYRRYIDKKKTNDILNLRNQEKDFLLKEIHHRVKNNLQILSSLLNLQAEYLKDENALNAITEGRNRVQSMAFIHQQLYTNDNIVSVHMQKYLSELCEHLSDSFSSDKKKIEIKSEINIDTFDVETAIPLGLIINELVTNSIKYAFRQRDRGAISVKLWKNDDHQLCLLVSDDGQGKSAQNNGIGTSFGTDLVEILSKKLKGTIQTDTSNGYTTSIIFDRFKAIV